MTLPSPSHPSHTTTDLKGLERAFLQTMSKEKFELQRNLSFGGAALAAGTLVALTQVGTKAVALQIATVAASTSLPTLVALGFLYEIYLHLGSASYPHSSTKFPLAISRILSWISMLGLLSTLGGVIWFLLPWAIAAFAFGVLLASVLFSLFIYQLARWWDKSPIHASPDR